MTPFHRIRMLPWLVAAGLALAGCSTTTPVDADRGERTGDVGPAPLVPAGAVPVAVDEIPGARTQISGHQDSSRVVISSPVAWANFWQRIVAGITPAPPAPAIDFGRSLVLAATMGERPSGGYAIRIDSVFVDRGTVYAVVRSISPGPTCGVAAVITAPVVAVRIDRVDGPIRFVERAESLACF